MTKRAKRGETYAEWSERVLREGGAARAKFFAELRKVARSGPILLRPVAYALLIRYHIAKRREDRRRDKALRQFFEGLRQGVWGKGE